MLEGVKGRHSGNSAGRVRDGWEGRKEGMVACRKCKKGIRIELRKWKKRRGGGEGYMELKRKYNKLMLCEKKKKEESDK